MNGGGLAIILLGMGAVWYALRPREQSPDQKAAYAEAMRVAGERRPEQQEAANRARQ